MTRYVPQWLQSGSYAASQDRRLIAALWPGPASAGCAVSATSGMVVNVAAGQVAVPTSNNTGAVLCTSDAVEAVTIGAAPVGNNRIDLVVCQARGNDVDGGSNNDFVFAAVAGTAAATPTPPAVPANAVALAQVYVGSGVASIVAANITDVRPFGLAIAGGVTRPPLNPADPLQSFTGSDGEIWVAKGGVNGGAWRKARDVLHTRVYRNAAFSIPAAATVLTFDGVQRDPYGMYNTSTGFYNCPVAGVYQLCGKFAWTPAAAGNWAQANFYHNGIGDSVPGSAQCYNTTPQHTPAAATPIYAAAGDTFQFGTAASVAVSGYSGQIYTYFSVDYLGTG